MQVEKLIAVGKGNKKADLVLKNSKVIDVLSGDIFTTNVAIYNGTIAGFGDYKANQEIDLNGAYLSPGLIDGHIHLESSMLSVLEFTKTVVPMGTTSVVVDPHEIANVLGIEGINYIFKASAKLPLDIYVMLPSCVPATDLETSGAYLSSGDLAILINHENVLGLAEMMNYPGVINCDHEVMNKLKIVDGKRIDGHCPGLTGKDLCAYIDAGISSDHECTSAEEATEKLRLGMYIMAREGSTAKNLEEVLKAVTPQNSRQFMLVSDDKQPEDLLKEGHVNYLLKKAIQLGIDPVTAVQMVTLNPAQYFRLNKKGAVAPGFIADLTVFEDIENFEVKMVIQDGKVVAENSMILGSFLHENTPIVLRGTVNVDINSLNKISVIDNSSSINVIKIVPKQIVTDKFVAEPKVENGFAVSDTGRDILKIIVVERHKSTGNIGVGFVNGFGLKDGAIASTVAHDSHNILVVGVNDEDIKFAVNTIIRMQGGQVVVRERKVLADLPLPIAGLMSQNNAEIVAKHVRSLMDAAKSLGTELENPFMELSFMALPVIPKLKITDKGLVDVEKFSVIPLFN